MTLRSPEKKQMQIKGILNKHIWIRIHSESRYKFTWPIRYNSDIIWCHCSFWYYFAHFNYSQPRCCLFAAVIAI